MPIGSEPHSTPIEGFGNRVIPVNTSDKYEQAIAQCDMRAGLRLVCTFLGVMRLKRKRAKPETKGLSEL
jgi:hypothetical protein